MRWPDDAKAMQTIASQPVGDWFGDWVPNIRTGVDARVTEITKAKALPILVAYDIPYRDCGQYSAGGQSDPKSYRTWVQAYADGIGDRAAGDEIVRLRRNHAVLQRHGARDTH